ncbi:hypothetical protein D5S17_26785 [Pseudonocardiaceae bacterium YIM PH 21723]|nr:hypothetical protein D5S17_26785 [Pseudonocardiaceae bacterium YIM PH 21723]
MNARKIAIALGCGAVVLAGGYVTTQHWTTQANWTAPLTNYGAANEPRQAPHYLPELPPLQPEISRPPTAPPEAPPAKPVAEKPVNIPSPPPTAPSPVAQVTELERSVERAKPKQEQPRQPQVMAAPARAAVLPGCAPGDYQVAPSRVNLSCQRDDHLVDGIGWTTWTATEATGIGTEYRMEPATRMITARQVRITLQKPEKFSDADLGYFTVARIGDTAYPLV